MFCSSHAWLSKIPHFFNSRLTRLPKVAVSPSLLAGPSLFRSSVFSKEKTFQSLSSDPPVAPSSRQRLKYIYIYIFLQHPPHLDINPLEYYCSPCFPPASDGSFLSHTLDFYSSLHRLHPLFWTEATMGLLFYWENGKLCPILRTSSLPRRPLCLFVISGPVLPAYPLCRCHCCLLTGRPTLLWWTRLKAESTFLHSWKQSIPCPEPAITSPPTFHQIKAGLLEYLFHLWYRQAGSMIWAMGLICKHHILFKPSAFLAW